MGVFQQRSNRMQLYTAGYVNQFKPEKKKKGKSNFLHYFQPASVAPTYFTMTSLP